MEDVMPDLKNRKNKHMSFDDRLEIQDCLNHGMTFKAIGQRIGKDQTTVSKEVKKHITVILTSVKRMDKRGQPIEAPICPQLLKVPFVCNPCKRRQTRCAFDKHIYYAKQAHNQYKSLLSESREGIPLNKEEFYKIDRVISNSIKKGQHIYHIMQTNDLGVSKSTVYRHFKRGYLSASVIDLPRAVKFKARRSRRDEYVPKALKIGRAYEDFLAFTEENDIIAWIEMDTVIGRIGGKVIMTLHFTFCNFMIGLLLENKTSAQVAEKVSLLKETFAANQIQFGEIFPLILTDNGGEFSDIFAIENNLSGQKETCLFFCDPYNFCQKSKIEKNHTLFRDIVPQGHSFDNFNQSTVDLIFSHINSVKRKSLNGKTPYEMFTFAYGEKIAEIFGILHIPAEFVVQSPKLLKR
jgi:IS30 family transposase